MNKIKNFFRITLIGGVLVILPIAVLIFVGKWLWDLVLSGIDPLADLLSTAFGHNGFIANLLALLIIVGFCFLIGLFVSTNFGKWFFDLLEETILNRIPGYRLIKETEQQFFGQKQSPFSQVVLAKIYENDTLVTGFITDERPDGVTIFVPTGPNPTNGHIYHLKPEYVTKVDVRVEDAMKTIIGCGTGSKAVFEGKVDLELKEKKE